MRHVSYLVVEMRVSTTGPQAERERVIGTTEKAAALDMLLSEKLATLEKLPEAVRPSQTQTRET